jgi:3-phosphoshikimate 1-carboxyvinyltransferase
MFTALARGISRVENFLPGADCLATIDVVQALGVRVEVANRLPKRWHLRVDGVGLDGLIEPSDVLDARNSGTTARLMLGILSGQSFFSVLTGDASLRSRPMGRVVRPLQSMGATVLGRQNGSLLPIGVRGGQLKAIEYELPVASAQVKSALLLAGLFAEGVTVLSGRIHSRDHTERMLLAMGADIEVAPEAIRVSRCGGLRPISISVPNDISSAAFWLVAGAVHPNAEIYLPAVGLNPTRAAVVDVLRRMGARIEVLDYRTAAGEPVADLKVGSSSLRSTDVLPEEIPLLIDEVPVLAVAMACAEGVSSVRGAEELRYKETDRLAAIASELGKMGAKVDPLPDGFVLYGPAQLKGAAVSSYGDHRMAMALGIAGLVAEGETRVDNPECVNVSYPGFWEDLESLSSAV